MESLVDSLSRLVGRIEILARGADAERRAAELALERGRPLDAREAARAMLEKVPESPIALALWASAAENAWLDHEAVEALEALSVTIPWRADVWLRLGRAKQRAGADGVREALERAVAAPEERQAAEEALVELCDLDLALGDVGRATKWLERLPVNPESVSRLAVALRRTECALMEGRFAEAEGFSKTLVDAAPIDGRAALARARVALSRGSEQSDPTRWQLAASEVMRAVMLEAPGAVELFAELVAQSRDVVLVSRLSKFADGVGLGADSHVLASFALAEGREKDAKDALFAALAAGSARALFALSEIAKRGRDLDLAERLAEEVTIDSSLASIGRSVRARREGNHKTALDLLDDVTSDLASWADSLRLEIVREWFASDVALWPEIIGELGATARALSAFEKLSSIAELAIEEKRPLVMAVIGEFNAGKSTFINALLGVDVAPTGVLPTTAALHWVLWAPDPFARIVVHGGADRVVPHDDLKAALSELEKAEGSIDRVYIYAPIERLRHVEILDTPGFNAPDPEHAKAARSAFEEAHLVVWLFDATHAMKASEREILSEIQALDVPILVLINKADRLKPEELAIVETHVAEALAEQKLNPVVPPLPFSARLSLKGRLGDLEALAHSGWQSVENALSEHVVDRRDYFKERALRRKTRVLASALATLAAAEEARAEERRKASHAAHADRERAKNLLRENAPILGEKLAPKLIEARRAFESDLSPLRQLGDASLDDVGLRSYIAVRAVARLAQPIALALAEFAGFVPSAETHGAVANVLNGLIAGADDPRSLELVRSGFDPSELTVKRAPSLFDRVIQASANAVGHALSVDRAHADVDVGKERWAKRTRALCAALD